MRIKCQFRCIFFDTLVIMLNSRTAIAGAFIGLLLVFFYLFRRRDFYDHVTSQPLQICFLLIHAISTEVRE